MLRVLTSRIRASNLGSLRCSSGLASTNNTEYKGIRSSIEKVVDSYEEFIGVKAVKEAQAGVMQWEEKLSEAQMIRREKQAEIKSVQSKIKDIHLELDKTSRGEDKYLHLITEEHSLIKQERSLLESFEQLETDEREAFHKLSNRVRESHEKERERVEKTKWWSVSASLIGALIGIIGTSIGNELRMKRLREILPIGSAKMGELARVIDEQNNTVTGFIEEMKSALKLDTLHVEAPKKVLLSDEDMGKVLGAIKEENARLSSQMAELTRLARLEAALDADPNAVVYVGSEMEHLLEQTERNIESKMKLQTLLSVVFLYTALGVTVPLIFAMFRGG
ncbi:unnamed protein product [Auanema sp. JU1783]|nr:unnamed protein product [Auanema sp. JU1783]